MNLKNQIQLIAYPNRIGTDLSDLATTLETDLPDVIKGVHILPMYPSNADAGFSPLTHTEVEPEYGTWQDIERIAEKFDLCVDVILNHISDKSDEFQDFLEKGEDSEYAEMFIDVAELGPISDEDLSKIHIRKEKSPFYTVTLNNGREVRLWTTFSEHQIDLDYRSEKTFELMDKYLTLLMDKGANLFRLDAFGYVTKEIGTSSFLVEPEIYHSLEWFKEKAQKRNAEILPEVHDHPSYQYAIASRDMYAYGFALPPLVLNAYLAQDSEHLQNWLRMCPHKQITVLDTHDGIAIPDVEGLIPPDDLQPLLDNLESRSGSPIMRKMAGNAHSVGAIYQITCTFFDALRQDEDAYIGARAIQFFTPGIPQVYYVGLVADENNHELVEESGEIRDINRHYYTLEEWRDKLNTPITQRLFTLMKFRNEYPAFNGAFELHTSGKTELRLTWTTTNAWCQLDVDFASPHAQITYLDTKTGDTRSFTV
jgi:sucrose phosphorylase